MKPNPSRSAADEPRILAIPNGPATSALRLIESVVAEALTECRRRGLPDCRITLDVGAEHAVAADGRVVHALLLPLVVGALERSSDRRSTRPPLRPEVLVTTIDTAAGLEIEVADSADQISAAGPATDPETTRLLDRIEGTLRSEGCPDGGTACTLRIPHSRTRRKVA